MRSVALRGLLARKTRLALTALAIALGVMLIAGTYVFSDTINRSFDKIFSSVYARVDVVLTPDDDVESSDGVSPPMDASVLQRAEQAPGVAAAAGQVQDQTGVILDKKGDPTSAGGAPSLIGSIAPARFEALEYPEGRAPATAREVALDRATADRAGYKLGDQVGLQVESGRTEYRLVGIAKIRGVDSVGGLSAAYLTLPEAQRLTGKDGKFDSILVAAASGTSAGQLASSVRRVVPAAVTVRTGAQQTASEQDDIREGLGFLTTALLAFAGIAVFVGAFTIFNTLSITVAQRMREFALLRVLGASRRQILRSVLTEGLVLGVLGSLVGLVLGILVASGLRSLFRAVGLDLPSSGNVIATRTIVVSLLVGIVVTLVASLSPALRATRVVPVEALRPGVAPPRALSSRRALIIAAVATALGVALMCVGLFGGGSDTSALSFLGGGAALTFLGVALLSPRLVGPIASAVGRPIEAAFGVTGRLARENAVRQPSRTAVTAAALMIGVALVSFASIFAAGAKTTVNGQVDKGLRGDFVLQNQAGFGPFSGEAARAAARVDGVREVTAVQLVGGRIPQIGSVTVGGVDPDTLTDLYNVTKGGDQVADLTTSTALVRKSFADDNGVREGQTLQLQTPTRRVLRLRVAGVFTDEPGLLGDVAVTSQLVRTAFGSTKDDLVLAGLDDGADATAVKAAIDRGLDRDFPQVKALTAKEFKGQQADQINQLLQLIYALLALAIVVSLFGIVNTLVLSITERTRELGMLRAVGTTRKQVRRMIRYEAVITALIGGVLGVALGVVLAVLVTRPLDDFVLSIPILTLVVVLFLSGVAGVLAAVLPARRASRLDVLRALAYE